MFQVLQRYVANIYSKCFICFRRVLQVFYLDIAYIVVSIHKWSKRMFQMLHMFQLYVAASVSCCKYRPPALVSTRAMATDAEGGVGRRWCGEEALVAQRRCGRGSCDSSAEESEAVEVTGARRVCAMNRGRWRVIRRQGRVIWAGGT